MRFAGQWSGGSEVSVWTAGVVASLSVELAVAATLHCLCLEDFDVPISRAFQAVWYPDVHRLDPRYPRPIDALFPLFSLYRSTIRTMATPWQQQAHHSVLLRGVLTFAKALVNVLGQQHTRVELRDNLRASSKRWWAQIDGLARRGVDPKNRRLSPPAPSLPQANAVSHGRVTAGLCGGGSLALNIAARHRHAPGCGEK